MRTLSKPSTAKCTVEHYTAFLLAEPQSAGCVRLAEVAGGEFAHDAANRFLNREDFGGRDLFEEARPLLDLEGGTLSGDDTVLDKPYRQEGKTELVGYFWSGKHGRAVKGICLVTLLYTDPQGVGLPVNFRLVDKAEAKTKNELFREMVSEVLAWGFAAGRGERRAAGTRAWTTSSSSGKRGWVFSSAWKKTASSANASMSTWRWKLWPCPRRARWCTCASLVL